SPAPARRAAVVHIRRNTAPAPVIAELLFPEISMVFEVLFGKLQAPVNARRNRYFARAKKIGSRLATLRRMLRKIGQTTALPARRLRGNDGLPRFPPARMP